MELYQLRRIDDVGVRIHVSRFAYKFNYKTSSVMFIFAEHLDYRPDLTAPQTLLRQVHQQRNQIIFFDLLHCYRPLTAHNNLSIVGNLCRIL